MRIASHKLDKRAWYRLGGFANPDLYRKGKGTGWEYYRDTSRDYYRRVAQPMASAILSIGPL